MAEKRRSGGFTLIELLIVMTIIGILASIAVPNYQRSVIKAREAVLMEDLYQMRRAIDAYFADHGKYPESLQGLVEAKYLRDIPRDPFKHRARQCGLPSAVAAGGPAHIQDPGPRRDGAGTDQARLRVARRLRLPLHGAGQPILRRTPAA